MEYGNVLVIGNSGVGKSTLINAVLGEDKAEVGSGSAGITKALTIYESKDETIPLRLIDTIGFEPSFRKKKAAIDAVKKWSKEQAKDGNPDTDINVIWFCVDGTSRKLFPDAIKSLSKATAMWKSVPVIAVITKSYSEPERKENVQMVYEAVNQQKKASVNLKAVIPVVAETYTLNATAFAAPEGIARLIEATNDAMPEGKQAAKQDVEAFSLKRKRVLAQSVVVASTAAGVAAGALPLPMADALVLSGIELAEINAIAGIFGLKSGDESKKFIDTIVEVGTVSAIAKAAIGALKAIPGINVAASVLNAVIAGCFVAAIGEGSAIAFEMVYKGEKTLDDLDWIKKFMEEKLSGNFLAKTTEVLEKASEKADAKDLPRIIVELIAAAFGPEEEPKAKK